MSESTPAAQKKPESVKEFLALPTYKNRFDEVLGKRAPQFLASISSAVSQSKLLASSEPRSVIAAAFVAATLDLPIDRNLGYAWLVPYAGQCQFQLGARGVIQLALRSGQYERLNARAINAEAFLGFDKQVGEPIIDWAKVDEAKPAVGYAVAWRLVNGFVKTAYWTKEKVLAHAERYSQAVRKKKSDSPWFTHPEKMALKTVVTNELKQWGILSVDMQRAMAHDQGSQRDIDADVRHDDGGLFEVEGSISDALSDEPVKQADAEITTDKKADVAKAATSQKSSPAEKASPEKQKLVDEIEGLALDLGFSSTKLLALGGAADAKLLKDLDVAQLTKVVQYCRDAAQLKKEA